MTICTFVISVFSELLFSFFPCKLLSARLIEFSRKEVQFRGRRKANNLEKNGSNSEEIRGEDYYEGTSGIS